MTGTTPANGNGLPVPTSPGSVDEDVTHARHALSDLTLNSSPRNEKGKEKAKTTACRLVALPAELIAIILEYLVPLDLNHVAATCRALYRHATVDRLWQAHVQDNVPGQLVTSSHPCATFRDLYRAHDPRWFLPKYKIWFADEGFAGQLVVTRYSQQQGCIKGHVLVAYNTDHSLHVWEDHSQTIIAAFSPVVSLHVEIPAIQLSAHPNQDPYEDQAQSQQSREGRNFQPEIYMGVNTGGGLHRSFIHARHLSPEDASTRYRPHFPYGQIWPPPLLPAPHRVQGAGLERPMFLRPRDRANSRGEVYQRAFRIHKWFDNPSTHGADYNPLGSRRPAVYFTGNNMRELTQYNPPPGVLTRRVNIAEAISTYATLDPELYTPTPTKPFRGIWVGDYGPHGCEFIWIHQPDDDDDDMFDPESIARYADESDEAYAARKHDATIYRGRLEAIKLTGDSNVPRGEYSFIVDDLGGIGFLRVAHEPPFEGVRVVKSRGHLASQGFTMASDGGVRTDDYVPSQLFLISPDRLAQNWITMSRVTLFQRVDIDGLLVPE
ncbi:protein executer 2, chloroplastic [Chaetomidium leptoderma]|uniref:Protein executer 2, chloroplastic n=1 Tax=Chaetomidium leptoderma TaxID=669021 RepID=A0AAN6VFL7_9PEZI|nr:protein executer 2, chloroplastic [Chaetomidium leptoderma]